MASNAGSDIFNHNVEAITSRGGLVDTEWLECVRHAGCRMAWVDTGRSGLPNIAYTKPDGKKIHLHSSFDPRGEAKRAISALGSWAGRHAILYGLGCGYYAEVLGEAVGQASPGALTVMECNPELALAALEEVDLTPIAGMKEARIFIGPGEKVVQAATARMRDLEAGRNDIAASIYVHPVAYSALPKEELSVRSFLCRIREGIYITNGDKDIKIAALYESIRKKIFSGVPLSDKDIGLLFCEAVQFEDRFFFFESSFEPVKMPDDVTSALVISLSMIGDVVNASAAFNGLRSRYPGARLVFLTEEPSPILYENSRVIDRVAKYSRQSIVREFSESPTAKNLMLCAERFNGILDDLRKEGFDTVFNLHPSARSALIAGALDVRPERRIGYSVGRDGVSKMRGNIWGLGKLLDRMPTALLPEEKFIRVIGLAPEKRESGVCVPKTPDGPWFWSPQHGFEEAVGVFPFGAVPVRCWGEEKFTEVCRHLMDDGRKVIVFAGPVQAEREGAERICGKLGAGASVGACDRLDQLGFALRNVKLLITNDTGPMHIAGAVGTRCLTVGGPSYAVPYSPVGHITVVPTMPCIGCWPISVCDKGTCFDLIKPDHIAELATAMLNLGPEGALAEYTGTVADGRYPHFLLTTGVYDSITPRYQIRFRDGITIEDTVATEVIRLAAFNVISMIEAEKLGREISAHELDLPGISSPFSAERAADEVRLRYKFVKYNTTIVIQNIAFTVERLSVPVNNPDLVFDEPKLYPIKVMIDFLGKAGMGESKQAALEIMKVFLDKIKILF